MRKLVGGIIGCGCLFVLVLVLVGVVGSRSSGRSASQVRDARTATGRVATLRSGNGARIIIAASKAAHERVTQLSVAGDTRGLAELALAGQAFLVDDGTRALVIDRGLLKSEVRIQGGPMDGRSGWVSTDFLRR